MDEADLKGFTLTYNHANSLYISNWLFFINILKYRING